MGREVAGLLRRRSVPMASALLLLLLLLAVGVSALPSSSAHGFSGFEVSGSRPLGPAGQANSTYELTKHGESGWRFEISFSATMSGNGTARAAILFRVYNATSVLSEFRGPAGALTIRTDDPLDYWINWSNPYAEAVDLQFRVAFLGPPSPIELSVILALGAAVMTLTVIVLAIDGLHAVARRDEQAQVEGYVKASELAREIKAGEAAGGEEEARK